MSCSRRSRTTSRTGSVVEMVSAPDTSETPATRGPLPESADAWLTTVAAEASRDAGGVPADLLGDYLLLLADAAIRGRRAETHELEAVGALGRRAAGLGVSAGRVVDLYLSAAWRLWGELPEVVRSRDSDVVRAAAEAVLHAVDDAVATLVEGYAEARRELVRREEGLRRQLVDDLLRGDAHLGELAERAEPFGLNLAAPHQVALAASTRAMPDVEAATSSLERRVFDWFGDRDVLVATKDGLLVVLAPAEQPVVTLPGHETAAQPIGERLHAELSRQKDSGSWRVSVGRPYPGAYGIARSYEEAREALLMATRLGVEEPVTGPQDLLIYRVLLRDQPAMTDLVTTVLGPLIPARGGAGPLLDTLDAYFASGSVATETAVRLHLSVRAVTYRLNRVRELTGYDPSTPAHRFILQAAVLGAKMLRWPTGAPSTAAGVASYQLAGGSLAGND